MVRVVEVPELRRVLMPKALVKILNGINNYVVIVNAKWNVWHSKTYCAKNPCWLENNIYESVMTIVRSLFEFVKYDIDNGKEVVVKAWRHRCGAEPRWMSVKLAAVLDKYGGLQSMGLCFHGGWAWQVCLSYDWRRLRKVIVFSDGCWGVKELVAMIKFELNAPGSN